MYIWSQVFFQQYQIRAFIQFSRYLPAAMASIYRFLIMLFQAGAIFHKPIFLSLCLITLKNAIVVKEAILYLVLSIIIMKNIKRQKIIPPEIRPYINNIQANDCE
jgi:hypothetical protein